MPLIFTARLKEERNFFKEYAEKWALKYIELMKRHIELESILGEYAKLGTIDYLKGLVENDKR